MRFLWLFLALALAGCNSANQTSLVTPTIAEAHEAATAPAISQTLETGVIRSFGGAYSHPPAEALLQETLQDLTRASGIEGLPQRVILLDSPVYNAAALPNGQLFITRGMLALANDRSEIAAALAHELGHVIARHSAQRVVARAQARADVINVARNFGDPEITRATVAAQQQSLAAFSREKELEADRIGVELLRKAGYDTAGALRMMQSLDRMGAFYANLARVRRAPSSPLATHPTTIERVEAMRKLVAGAAGGRVERDRYLASISGMTFGETGRGGFVRGRSFLHRGLDIAITMPPGYVVRGYPDAVGAVKQGGKSVMIFRRMSDGVAKDPEAALRLLLARAQVPVSISPVGGDGRGAVAAVDTATGKSRLAVVVVGERAYRLFMTSTAPDAAFDKDFAAAVASLRNLGLQDERIARQQALRIVRADGPGALARLAAQSGDPDHGLQLLLALNGLRSTTEVRPGSQIKALELSNPTVASGLSPRSPDQI
jgi:predicted Zn-dependent protease